MVAAQQLPPAVTPIDVLLKLHDVTVTDEQIAAWQEIEEAVATYLALRADYKAAADLRDAHKNSLFPNYPHKVEHWQELLIWHKRQSEWEAEDKRLDTAAKAAWALMSRADSKLRNLLPVPNVWMRFGDTGIRNWNNNEIECRPWAELGAE